MKIYLAIHSFHYFKILLFPWLFCLLFLTAAKSDDVHEFQCVKKVWYRDLDLDGYGNPLKKVMRCYASEGYVERAGDCNDNPRKRGTLFFPGAKEPCHYDDYNCDGKVRRCAKAPKAATITQQKDQFIMTSFESTANLILTPEKRNHFTDSSGVFPGIKSQKSVLMQTKGDGVATLLRGIDHGLFDFSQSMPRIWLKAENISHIRDLSLFLGNNNFKNYAQFNLNSRQGQKWITEGDWVSLAIPWNESDLSRLNLQPGVTLADLRRNITDFQVRLIDDQTNQPVKLHLSRLSAVKEEREKYPNGVVSITFDDNWLSEYTHAKPKMDQYGFAATTYVIIGFLDTPNYLTTAQLRELQKDSQWEISFHAFDPIMHIQTYTKFPASVVERDILAGRQWMWENGFGLGDDGKHGIAHFAYPKGEFHRSPPGRTDVLSIVRKHFSSARTINERHRETTIPSDAHKLRVLYVTGPESVESVMTKIDKGIEAGEWIILVFHDLVEHPVENDQWEISKFQTLIDYIGTHPSEVPVRTVGDVLSEIESK